MSFIVACHFILLLPCSLPAACSLLLLACLLKSPLRCNQLLNAIEARPRLWSRSEKRGPRTEDRGPTTMPPNKSHYAGNFSMKRSSVERSRWLLAACWGCQSVSLSVRPSVCLPVRLSVCVSLSVLSRTGRKPLRGHWLSWCIIMALPSLPCSRLWYCY